MIALLDAKRMMYVRQSAIERIFSQQTEKGYWITRRITDPKSSNVDGTAFILVDLSTVPELSKDHRISLGVKHLLSNQNLDGGWSDLKGEPSRPTITSYVLWALGKYDVRSTKEVEQGVHWLEKNRCEDGGWTEIVERPWEGGIRPGETQPWITASCIRGLNNCPQTQNKVIRKALAFLEKTQRQNGSWEGRMGTDMVLLTFKELGLTIEKGIVRRGVDYELSFQNPDGFLPDAWGGKTLIPMVKNLYKFLELGVPLEDEKISKMMEYLSLRKKNLITQLYKICVFMENVEVIAIINCKIFKTLEDLNRKYGILLL